MKRLIVSVIVVATFTFYAIFSRGNSAAQAVTNPGDDASGSSSGTTTAQPAGSSSYADGTYTGSQANAFFGVVQVQATIKGGRITDVQVLSHPTGHHSDQVNAAAVPVLTQEAISAQSANVQVVSGATLTSEAFMQSLQSALSQA